MTAPGRSPLATTSTVARSDAGGLVGRPLDLGRSLEFWWWWWGPLGWGHWEGAPAPAPGPLKRPLVPVRIRASSCRGSCAATLARTWHDRQSPDAGGREHVLASPRMVSGPAPRGEYLPICIACE